MLEPGVLAGLKRALAWTKWLFTPLAIAFLVNAAWQSREALGVAFASSVPAYIVLALLAHMASHLLSPLFASIVLKATGAEIQYPQALDLHLRYLPARYLPGGIWHTVARVHRLHGLGVRPGQLGSFVLLEQFMALGVTLSVGGAIVHQYTPEDGWSQAALILAVLGCTLIALVPVGINRWILSGDRKLRPSRYGRAIATVLAFWGCMTSAFLCYVAAFPDTFSVAAWIEIAGAYLLGWGIGFMAIFAPQGVGVFEVVAGNLVPAKMSFATVAALLAGFRLLLLISDTVAWLAWSALNISRRAQRQQSSSRP